MKCSKITILLGLLLLVTTTCQSRGQNLPFESIAQRDTINYREESPALFVITSNDEIDALVSTVLAEDPALADQLRQLDYDRFFAILILQGQKGGTGYAVTVSQIVREEEQATIEAEFVEPSPDAFIKPAFTSPYHLVAVSKQGEWGQQIHFVLVTDSEKVAETSHFIP